jgi:hypothetical protein
MENSNLYKALLKFQSKNILIQKEDKVKFGAAGGYSYASYHKIREMINKDLTECGLVVFHKILMKEIKDGTPIRIVRTILAHAESGEHEICDIPIRPTDIDKNSRLNCFQEQGKIITYYCRYGINSILGLAFIEDTDANIESNYKKPYKGNNKKYQYASKGMDIDQRPTYDDIPL